MEWHPASTAPIGRKPEMWRSDMAITHPAKHFARRSVRWTLGPQVTFAVVVLTAFIAMAASSATSPNDLVLPLTSVLLLVVAGLVALVAWSREGPCQQGRTAHHVTYWDVAGALAFIGICVAALVDPDQMTRLMEGTYRDQ